MNNSANQKSAVPTTEAEKEIVQKLSTPISSLNHLELSDKEGSAAYDSNNLRSRDYQNKPNLFHHAMMEESHDYALEGIKDFEQMVGRVKPLNKPEKYNQGYSGNISMLSYEVSNTNERLTLLQRNHKKLQAQEFSNEEEGNAEILFWMKSKRSIDSLNEEPSLKDDKLQETLIKGGDLGKGQFGTVSWVCDEKLNHIFAKKELTRFSNRDAEQEYQALLEIKERNSPRLLTVLKLDYIPSKRFSAVMEYGLGTLTVFLEYLSYKKWTWDDVDLLELFFMLDDQAKELREINH